MITNKLINLTNKTMSHLGNDNYLENMRESMEEYNLMLEQLTNSLDKVLSVTIENSKNLVEAGEELKTFVDEFNEYYEEHK